MRLQCFNSIGGRVGADFNARCKKRQALITTRFEQMRANVRTVSTISNQNLVVLREAFHRVLKDEQKDRAQLFEELTAFAQDDITLVKQDLADLAKQLEEHLNETFTCTIHAKAAAADDSQDGEDGTRVEVEAEAYIDI